MFSVMRVCLLVWSPHVIIADLFKLVLLRTPSPIIHTARKRQWTWWKFFFTVCFNFNRPTTKLWECMYSVVSVCLSFCQFTGGPPCDHKWTCSNLFTWDPSAPAIPYPTLLTWGSPSKPWLPALTLDMVELVYLGKRAVGLRLKGLLFWLKKGWFVLNESKRNRNLNLRWYHYL